MPVKLTDVLLNEEIGVRLDYLGEPNVVLDGVGDFVVAINLTTDLPSCAKLSKVGFEYVFIPDYLSP